MGTVPLTGIGLKAATGVRLVVREQQAGSFVADGDDGQVYTVIIWQKLALAINTWVPTIQAFRLQDGQPVNRNGPDEFEVVAPSVILTPRTPVA